MNDLALNDFVGGAPPPAGAMRRVRWLALFLVLAGLVLPNCCLNGNHAFGSGMASLGAFCRAATSG